MERHLEATVQSMLVDSIRLLTLDRVRSEGVVGVVCTDSQGLGIAAQKCPEAAAPFVASLCARADTLGELPVVTLDTDNL